MRNNADRFPRLWEGRRPVKKRSAGTRSQPRHGAVQWGFGGRATNKRSASVNTLASLAGFSTPVPPQGKPLVLHLPYSQGNQLVIH